MDGDFFGFYRVKPDQIQVINPVLIIIMIPLFEYFLYPALRRCGLLTKPLKKMALGGFLAAASFVAAALIEVMIERELPGALAANQSHVTFVNGANCQLDIVNAHFKSHLEPFGTFAKEINLNVDSLDFNITATCKGSEAQTIAYNATLSSQNYTLVYIVLDETNTPTLDILEYDHEIQKPHSGGADVRILYNLQLLSPVPDGPFILRDKFTNAEVRRGNEVRGMSFPVEIDPTKGDIELILPNGREFETLDLKQGAAYLIVIGNDHEKVDINVVKRESHTCLFLSSTLVNRDDARDSITQLREHVLAGDTIPNHNLWRDNVLNYGSRVLVFPGKRRSA